LRSLPPLLFVEDVLTTHIGYSSVLVFAGYLTENDKGEGAGVVEGQVVAL
jgi:hypothetical protein